MAFLSVGHAETDNLITCGTSGDGGPTDLQYAALLCGYHHHWVHIHRLAGRVVEGHVRWDLAAGSYDT